MILIFCDSSVSVYNMSTHTLWQSCYFRQLAPYIQTLQEMDQCVARIKAGHVSQTLWFLEHLPVYTAGSRTESEHLKQAQEVARAQRIPVVITNRGGGLTYHGPGQLLIYPMIDLRQHKWTIDWYRQKLEQWLCHVLEELGVHAFTNPYQAGLWTTKGKIASIGIHVSRGITSHGCALNISCDLSPFHAITACNTQSLEITSLSCFIKPPSIPHLVQKLMNCCPFSSDTTFCTIEQMHGVVAQLEERVARIDKARGSIPLSSTGTKSEKIY